jgi:hypothetical protein
MIDGPLPTPDLKPYSKIPAYRAAFRAYIERTPMPTPSDLAAEFNLHPVGIAVTMDKQRWPAARIMYQASLHAVQHIHLDTLAQQTQDKLCGSAQNLYAVMIPEIEKCIRSIEELDTEPPKTGARRGKSRATLTRTKLDLLKLAAQTFEKVTDTALALGLNVPRRRPGEREDPAEHAKIAELDGRLQQAMHGPDATDACEEPLEFDVEPESQPPA